MLSGVSHETRRGKQVQTVPATDPKVLLLILKDHIDQIAKQLMGLWPRDDLVFCHADHTIVSTDPELALRIKAKAGYAFFGQPFRRPEKTPFPFFDTVDPV